MESIQLIISCNHCGHVERCKVTSEEQARRTFKQFSCPKSCRRKYYSYISVRSISKSEIEKAKSKDYKMAI